MADEEVIEQEIETENENEGETETTETTTEGGSSQSSSNSESNSEYIVVPYPTLQKKYEVSGSRQLRVNNNGCTGTYTLRGFPYSWFATNTVPQAFIPGASEDGHFFGDIVPYQNTSWDDTYWYIKLSDIEVKEVENGLGEAICNYTSEGRLPTLSVSNEDYSLKATVSFNSTTHKVVGDCKWAINTPSEATAVQNPYVDSIEFVDAYMEYSLEYQQNYAPSANKNLEDFVSYAKTASTAYNSINGAVWHSFPARSMLCTSINCEPAFSFDGKLISIITRATFKIIRDSNHNNHNLLWREPTPMTDSQGNDMVWHNIPNQPYPYNQFYTTDIYKVGTKVYIDDITITTDANGLLYVTPVSPTPVHGGWYAPYYETFTGSPGGAGFYRQWYLYDEVDFTTCLGIPRFSNDPDPNDNSIS